MLVLQHGLLAIVHSFQVSIGEGLAYNYYAGYLRLVLPSLAARVGTSEYEKHMKFKKMFVLIPANGEMPTKLQNADGTVHQVGELEPCVVERAGVKRKYSNVVYGTTHNEKEVMFVADLPANILTLRDMVMDQELTGFSEEDKLREVQKYAAFLQKILKSQPHMAGMCEIIVYNDDAKMMEAVRPHFCH
ncbi:PREDICTED: stimulator of interferon genes protein-like [Priapulus caudatus]|uniref:Stimulator of interferon genes protein-like n=1 Tax=Priapulus caudatus TaxID=37621 RepID=A0ABM1F010_PRICU|nr:PREDICTED: stimulator of interferon genes protein-like [Priapulus caudatus]